MIKVNAGCLQNVIDGTEFYWGANVPTDSLSDNILDVGAGTEIRNVRMLGGSGVSGIVASGDSSRYEGCFFSGLFTPIAKFCGGIINKCRFEYSNTIASPTPAILVGPPTAGWAIAPGGAIINNQFVGNGGAINLVTLGPSVGNHIVVEGNYFADKSGYTEIADGGYGGLIIGQNTFNSTPGAADINIDQSTTSSLAVASSLQCVMTSQTSATLTTGTLFSYTPPGSVAKGTFSCTGVLAGVIECQTAGTQSCTVSLSYMDWNTQTASTIAIGTVTGTQGAGFSLSLSKTYDPSTALVITSAGSGTMVLQSRISLTRTG